MRCCHRKSAPHFVQREVRIFMHNPNSSLDQYKMPSYRSELLARPIYCADMSRKKGTRAPVTQQESTSSVPRGVLRHLRNFFTTFFRNDFPRKSFEQSSTSRPRLYARADCLLVHFLWSAMDQQNSPPSGTDRPWEEPNKIFPRPGRTARGRSLASTVRTEQTDIVSANDLVSIDMIIC